jgi:hypothetical protein
VVAQSSRPKTMVVGRRNQRVVSLKHVILIKELFSSRVGICIRDLLKNGRRRIVQHKFATKQTCGLPIGNLVLPAIVYTPPWKVTGVSCHLSRRRRCLVGSTSLANELFLKLPVSTKTSTIGILHLPKKKKTYQPFVDSTATIAI